MPPDSSLPQRSGLVLDSWLVCSALSSVWDSPRRFKHSIFKCCRLKGDSQQALICFDISKITPACLRRMYGAAAQLDRSGCSGTMTFAGVGVLDEDGDVSLWCLLEDRPGTYSMAVVANTLAQSHGSSAFWNPEEVPKDSRILQFQCALAGLLEQVEAEARLLPLGASSSNILVVTTTEGFRLKLADFRWMAALQEPRSAVQPPYGDVSTASLAGHGLFAADLQQQETATALDRASHVAAGTVTVTPAHSVYLLGMVMLELMLGRFGMFASLGTYAEARSLIRGQLWRVNNPAQRELLGECLHHDPALRPTLSDVADAFVTWQYDPAKVTSLITTCSQELRGGSSFRWQLGPVHNAVYARGNMLEASGSMTVPPTAEEAATWSLQQRKEAPLLSTCCFKQPAAAGAAEVVDGGPPTIHKLSGAVGTTHQLRNNMQHYDQGGDASKAALLQGAGLVADRTSSSFIKLLPRTMPQYLCRLSSTLVKWGRQQGVPVFGASAPRQRGAGRVMNMTVMRGQHSRPASTSQLICSARNSASIEQQEAGQPQQAGQQQPAGQHTAGRLHGYGVPAGTCCLYERSSISSLPYEQACMLLRPLPVLLGVVQLLNVDMQPFSLFAASMMSAADDILLGRLTGAEVVCIACTAATTCLAAGLLSRLDSCQQYMDRASLLVQYLSARYPCFVVAGAGESVVVQLLVHRVLQLFSGQRLLLQEHVNAAQQVLEQFSGTHGTIQDVGLATDVERVKSVVQCAQLLLPQTESSNSRRGQAAVQLLELLASWSDSLGPVFQLWAHMFLSERMVDALLSAADGHNGSLPAAEQSNPWLDLVNAGNSQFAVSLGQHKVTLDKALSHHVPVRYE